MIVFTSLSAHRGVVVVVVVIVRRRGPPKIVN
jgi:hypothetical protein